MKLLHAASLVFGLALGAAAPAHAQEYPQKPIRLMVPLAAGSTADILCRVVGDELARRLGQPVVVENKTGAGGTIAMAELARAPADGYTIAFGSQGTLVFNQSLYSKPGCHLCDEMKHVIDRVSARKPLTLEIVDISTDPQLTDLYGLEIPVLLIDGRKAAKYRLTEWELEDKLKRLAPK